MAAAYEAGAQLRPEPGTVNVEIHAPHIASIILRGECDISTAPRLADALERTNQRTHAIIDLSECEFVDSTIIGVLNAAHRTRDARGTRLEVVLPASASEIVNRVFALMQLRDILSVHDSAEAARTALDGKR